MKRDYIIKFLFVSLWACLIYGVTSGCSPLRTPAEELTFGDRAAAVSGPYKGSSVQILSQISDDYMRPCKVHQYHASISKNNLTTTDYVCHEDLRVK